jgi:hypothetical protein
VADNAKDTIRNTNLVSSCLKTCSSYEPRLAVLKLTSNQNPSSGTNKRHTPHAISTSSEHAQSVQHEANRSRHSNEGTARSGLCYSTVAVWDRNIPLLRWFTDLVPSDRPANPLWIIETLIVLEIILIQSWNPILSADDISSSLPS